MIWETPAFIDLRMDSEIGSYQDDFDRDEGPLFAERADDDDAAAS